MKKHLFIIALWTFLSALCFGQNRAHYAELVSEGNRFLEQEQYHLAIELYKQALSLNISDPAVDYALAECYRHTFNYADAEAYYLKALYTGQSDFPRALFYYALMLKLNGNFSEAMERFDQFIAFHENNAIFKGLVEQAIVEQAGCDIARAELGMPAIVQLEPVKGSINSAYNDFAPAFRDTATLVITSSRISSNRAPIDERYGEGFTDNYYFEKTLDTWNDRTRREFSKANGLYHDGSGTFTKDGSRYFFTICEVQCRIYETHLENNKWTTPVALNDRVNLSDAESKQPAISPGGDTLYFASNRPGGYGGFDIWMSIDAGENQWSAPVNAGRMINTKADDMTPAVTPLQSVLFFASKGHPGYGGFDLFVAKGMSNGDTVVYNLNFPFNSVKDDCFITFNDEQTFWSSNRDGGIGGFDIYAGHKMSAIKLVSRLSLKNRNDSRSVVLTSRTARSDNISLLASRNEETIDYNKLTYEQKALVNRMVENKLNNIQNGPGSYPELSQEEFDVLHGVSHTRFQMLLLNQKYASTLLTEVTGGPSVEDAVSVTGQLIDSRNGRPLRYARVLLTDEYGEILKITSTNEHGQFRFTDVSQSTKLFLRLEKQSGQGSNAFVRNIAMMGSDKKNGLYVENVYFDFDHYAIRPEASQVLAGLANYLKSNPGAQVEIYAFADDRGSSAYNFELTQKRGEAVVAYLTKHGVDESSLAIIPKGKQSIKRAATELQRQYNRRAEFYINGVREEIAPSIKTYILKKETDWEMISRVTGISKDQLKHINAAETDVVRAFQPVRLPLQAKTISPEYFFVGI